MKDEIKALKERVAALETMIITGTSGNQYQMVKAVGEEPLDDPDNRVQRIADIIGEELRASKSTYRPDYLKRGIRLALNEFYTGPYPARDLQAELAKKSEDIIALNEHIGKIEHDLRVAFAEKAVTDKALSVYQARMKLMIHVLNVDDTSELLEYIQENP